MIVIEHLTPSQRIAFTEAWLAAGGDLDLLLNSVALLRRQAH